ncbi:MAG: hypothetical protein ACJAVW_003047, partial [Spirosomataceae bacterium]
SRINLFWCGFLSNLKKDASVVNILLLAGLKR